MEATFSSVERKVDQTFRTLWVMNFQTFSWVFCHVSKSHFNLFIACLLPNMWETSNPPTIQEYFSKKKETPVKLSNKNPSQIWRKSNKSTQTLPIGRGDAWHVHGSSRQINSPFSGQVCGPSTATWKVRNSQWFSGLGDGNGVRGYSFPSHCASCLESLTTLRH